MRKIVIFMLTVSIIFSLLTVGAFADGEAVEEEIVEQQVMEESKEEVASAEEIVEEITVSALGGEAPQPFTQFITPGVPQSLPYNGSERAPADFYADETVRAQLALCTADITKGGEDSTIRDAGEYSVTFTAPVGYVFLPDPLGDPMQQLTVTLTVTPCSLPTPVVTKDAYATGSRLPLSAFIEGESAEAFDAGAVIVSVDGSVESPYLIEPGTHEVVVAPADNFVFSGGEESLTLSLTILDSVKVTFDMQGHGLTNIPAAQSYEVGYNGKIVRPSPDPADNDTKFVFRGWYKEPGCENPWDFETDTVSGDTVLYAKWLPVYRVVFNMKNHGTPPAAQYVVKGEFVIKPEKPTAKGYSFNGWYKESSCKNEWDFETDTVTKNTTLYARWTIAPKTSDESNMALWLGLCVMGVAGTLGAGLILRRKEN